ncbi:MAG: hypothetical protein NUV81_00830 [bacterium]|nr:hypothetical protein [bacterium]
MASQQVSSLFRYGLYQFGEVVFKNGRATPYTVRLPKSSEKELFQSLAGAAWSLDQVARIKNVHCMGIAKSGVPLAEALYEYGRASRKCTKFSVVTPHALEQGLDPAADDDEMTTILIDNAVTTGKTVKTVLDMVRRFGYRPEIVVRIFDREDIGEDGLSTVERIWRDTGLDLVSIFRLRDILPSLSSMEREAVLSYQSKYGTASFKKWIGDDHVL